MTVNTIGGLNWGQVVQILLRCMEHTPKGENSAEQAERMANQLFARVAALTSPESNSP